MCFPRCAQLALPHPSGFSWKGTFSWKLPLPPQPLPCTLVPLQPIDFFLYTPYHALKLLLVYSLLSPHWNESSTQEKDLFCPTHHSILSICNSLAHSEHSKRTDGGGTKLPTPRCGLLTVTSFQRVQLERWEKESLNCRERDKQCVSLVTTANINSDKSCW